MLDKDTVTGLTLPTSVRVLLPHGHVEEMKLETYLAGVVATEIGASAPLEALKAQAVAARTYAVAARRHPEHEADVCTTAHCQKWKRVDPVVAPEVFRALSETWGMVALYDGKLIDAFFFEHCDGHTRNSEDMLMPTVEYLRGVACSCGFLTLKGHGVGMCKRGAIVMARRGASFQQILRHYYRGVVVIHTPREKAAPEPQPPAATVETPPARVQAAEPAPVQPPAPAVETPPAYKPPRRVRKAPEPPPARVQAAEPAQAERPKRTRRRTPRPAAPSAPPRAEAPPPAAPSVPPRAEPPPVVAPSAPPRAEPAPPAPRPIRRAPVAQKPVEEKPVEEKPVEEKPAEITIKAKPKRHRPARPSAGVGPGAAKMRGVIVGEVVKPAASPSGKPPRRVQIDHLPGARMIAGCLPEAGVTVLIEDPDGNKTVTVSGSAPHYGEGGFELLVGEDGRYLVTLDDQVVEVNMDGETVFIHAN